MKTPKNSEGLRDLTYSIKEVSIKSCVSCKKGLPADTIPRRLNQLCLGKLKSIQDINFNVTDVMNSVLKYYDTEDVGVELKGFKYYEQTIKDYLNNLSNNFEKQTDYKIAFQLNSRQLQNAEERPEDITRYQKEIADVEERIPKEKHIIDFLSQKLTTECEEIAKLEEELRKLDYEVMKVEEDLIKQEAVLKENAVDKERIREIKPLKEAFNIEIQQNVATINAVCMQVDKKEECWQYLNQGLGTIVWMSQYFLQRQQIKLEKYGPLKTWNEKGQFKKGLSILLSIQKIVAESFLKNLGTVGELPYPVKPDAVEIDRMKLEIDLDKAQASTLAFSKFLKNWLFLIEIACE